MFNSFFKNILRYLDIDDVDAFLFYIINNKNKIESEVYKSKKDLERINKNCNDISFKAKHGGGYVTIDNGYSYYSVPYVRNIKDIKEPITVSGEYTLHPNGEVTHWSNTAIKKLK